MDQSVKRSVILATDKMFLLPTLFGSLGDSATSTLNVIAATNEDNLAQLIDIIKPELVIIRFSHYNFSEQLLDQIRQYPLLFLLRGNEKLPTLFNYGSFRTYSSRIENCENQGLFLYEEVFRVFEDLKNNENNLGIDEQEIKKFVLEIQHKNDLLINIKDRLKKISNQVEDNERAELRSIIFNIGAVLSASQHNFDFTSYIENEQFVSSIKKQYPKLTSDDLKYCYFMKHNLSNRDIAMRLGISPESVRTHKYRLKKKMTLSREIDLHYHIQGF